MKGQFVLRSKTKAPISPDQIYKLAAAGMSKPEIAKEIGLSLSRFERRMTKERSLYHAWECGAKQADTFSPRQKSPLADDDIPLQPVDQTIWQTLVRCGQLRVKHLHEITGVPTSRIVTSLERLLIHGFVDAHEGVVFTEYNTTDKRWIRIA